MTATASARVLCHLCARPVQRQYRQHVRLVTAGKERNAVICQRCAGKLWKGAR